MMDDPLDVESVKTNKKWAKGQTNNNSFSSVGSQHCCYRPRSVGDNVLGSVHPSTSHGWTALPILDICLCL